MKDKPSLPHIARLHHLDSEENIRSFSLTDNRGIPFQILASLPHMSPVYDHPYHCLEVKICEILSESFGGGQTMLHFPPLSFPRVKKGGGERCASSPWL